MSKEQKIEKVRQLVAETKGRFFKVRFIKKDGSVRELVGRRSVSKFVKGSGRNKSAEVITVWVPKLSEYRVFRPESVLSFKCGDKEVVFA